MHTKGKFIVIYGANNLGKSTQIGLLAKAILARGLDVLKVKYAIYGLEPTGPLINTILRAPDTLDKKYSEDEFQKIQAQNKKDFQPIIQTLLGAGINVVAEDYKGTGIAWGLTRDVSIETLEKNNEGLIDPDLAILLDGERFTTKVEAKHRNEDGENGIWEKNRKIQLELAEKYNWEKVNANQIIEKVHEDIMKLVEPLINPKL